MYGLYSIHYMYMYCTTTVKEKTLEIWKYVIWHFIILSSTSFTTTNEKSDFEPFKISLLQALLGVLKLA